MAGKKLTYTVDVDDSDLRKLGQAFTDAGRDAKQAFTGLEGALAKANADTNGLETNLAGLTAAFNAVKAASGGAFSDDEVVAYVQSLGRMGASMDEVVADADRVAASLKRATDVNMGRTVEGADQVSQSLKRIGTEGDNSRSVMANMAGNAAQDLGEVAGISGTLGVGLGQLAEYASEGNIALRNLAGVAGPMAGLAAATLLLNSYMSNVAKTKAFNADQVDSFTEAIEEAGAGVGAVNTALREAEAITGLIEDSNPLSFFTDTEFDITPKLQEFGITLAQVERVIADTGESADFMALKIDGTMLGFHNVTPELAAFVDVMNEAGVAGADQVDIIRVLQQQQGNYQASVKASGTTNEFYAATLKDINTAMLGVSNTALQTDHNLGIILDDLADGTVDTDRAREAWNILQQALGLTNEQMVDMVNTKLAERIDADAEAAAAATESFAAFYDQMKAVNEAGEALNLTLGSAEFDAAGINEAADALSRWFDASTVAGGTSESAIFAYQDALDAFAANLVENEGIVQGALSGMFTVKGPEAREQLGVLEQLGETIMPQITQAFDDADGSFEQFDRSVSAISDKLHNELVQALIDSGVEAGDAEGQANSLQQALGLIPSNVRTMFDLQGDAEAVAKLALLQGVIDGLPPEVQTEVALHVLADNPQAALATIETYARNHPPTSPLVLDPDTAAAQAELDRTNFYATLKVRAVVQNIGSLFGSSGSSSSGSRSTQQQAVAASSAELAAVDAFAEPSPAAVMGTSLAVPYVPTLAAAGPAVAPVEQHFHVAINAAVIGNRYDLDRQVRASLRRSARLNGQRAAGAS